ncbi:transcriptional regulator with XRE-family HTH domain [Paraburkholderia sp. GAS41]|uniref:helix-turn-helix domain-containing protein n=1 Tax=Paraburkholderia sp. GAS41 TaxID=3035134 RepID=UPI003D22D2CC
MTENQIGAAIRAWRVACGLTIAELSEKAGVSTLSKIETGAVSATGPVLERLAAVMGLTLSEMFTVPAGDSRALAAFRRENIDAREPTSKAVAATPDRALFNAIVGGIIANTEWSNSTHATAEKNGMTFAEVVKSTALDLTLQIQLS